MKRTIPDGDPILDLTDEEHKILFDFKDAWKERVEILVSSTPPPLMTTLAALICFMRPPEPYLRDYTGAIIHWNRDGKGHYAECHLHDGIWCHTTLGMVRADLVAEYENGSAFRGHRKIDPHGPRLTGVL
jgi:hypothetical protein